jgi:putative endonuclease
MHRGSYDFMTDNSSEIEQVDIRHAFIYLLATCDGRKPKKTYVGWTFDVNARLEKHNSGTGAKSTKGRQWQVIHTEKLEDKFKAMSREYFLKKDHVERKKLRNKFEKK